MDQDVQDDYMLMDAFTVDTEVKVFTILGRTLRGKVLKRSKNNILLLETQTNRQAYINLDHIISITGDV